MFNSIYNMIAAFVVTYPITTFYLVGSLLSVGITYTLISYGFLKPQSVKRMFFTAAVSSWIIVVVFLYGFFSSIFIKNDEEE